MEHKMEQDTFLLHECDLYRVHAEKSFQELISPSPEISAAAVRITMTMAVEPLWPIWNRMKITEACLLYGDVADDALKNCVVFSGQK